jgi:hypothetical protein
MTKTAIITHTYTQNACRIDGCPYEVHSKDERAADMMMRLHAKKHHPNTKKTRVGYNVDETIIKRNGAKKSKHIVGELKNRNQLNMANTY